MSGWGSLVGSTGRGKMKGTDVRTDQGVTGSEDPAGRRAQPCRRWPPARRGRALSVALSRALTWSLYALRARGSGNAVRWPIFSCDLGSALRRRVRLGCWRQPRRLRFRRFQVVSDVRPAHLLCAGHCGGRESPGTSGRCGWWRRYSPGWGQVNPRTRFHSSF